MKKMVRKLSLLLAILMIVCTSALADTQIASTYVPTGRNISFNLYSNTIAQVVSEGDTAYYVLFDALGNPLTTEHYLAMESSMGYWKVAVGDGINNVGLLDAGGRLIMPMEYGAIDVISEKWTIGVVLEAATVDQYDYKSWDGESFYLVTAYDVYFDGTKIGSLARTAYASAYSHGDYLYVTDRAQDCHFYNRGLVESGYQADYTAIEYNEVYKDGSNTYWHKGSNQQAFVPGCTLTADEVELSLKEINGKFYDLQGNVAFEFNQYYDYFRDFEGDYAIFRAHDKYGLIDRSGNVVLPAEYDEIISFTRPDDTTASSFFPCGYQAVVKDGKLGYVDLNGNVTCEFKYNASNIKYSQNPNFATLQDLDGSYIVLSAAIGELPERFADVSMTTNWSECIAVQNAEGLVGVLDTNGNEVLPFTDGISMPSYYSFSRDGQMLALTASGNTAYYTLAHVDNKAAEAPTEIAVAPAEIAVAPVEAVDAPAENANAPAETVDAPAETVDSNDWTCTCSAANNGNFCTNCGSARPEEAESIVCSGCGYQPDPENVPNFCPECGQKFGE